MKKNLIYLCLVLVLCLCLCMVTVACQEQPVDNQPPVETPAPEGSDEIDTPNAPAAADANTDASVNTETDSGKKGELHLTPGGDSADVKIPEPNEQLPDSTLRG